VDFVWNKLTYAMALTIQYTYLIFPTLANKTLWIACCFAILYSILRLLCRLDKASNKSHSPNNLRVSYGLFTNSYFLFWLKVLHVPRSYQSWFTVLLQKHYFLKLCPYCTNAEFILTFIFDCSHTCSKTCLE